MNESSLFDYARSELPWLRYGPELIEAQVAQLKSAVERRAVNEDRDLSEADHCVDVAINSMLLKRALKDNS